MLWQGLDEETAALEIPGVGAVVRNVIAPGEFGMVFVPGVRVLSGRLVKDMRAAPLLAPQATAEAILAKQNYRNPDPAAEGYMVIADDGEY